MVQSKTLNLELLKKQFQFVRSDAREILFSGAFAAGKSLALCARLVARANQKGAREGLFRKYRVTLVNSTLKTLLEGDGTTPPILPEGSYRHIKSESCIKINNGGQIIYGGADDEQRITSLNLSGVAIDQAEECSETEYQMLNGRPRLGIKGLGVSTYSVCNPSSPEHHLAIRFGCIEGRKAAPGCELIKTCTMDNPHLPASYLETLAQWTGVARQRYVEGLWVGNEGLVYAMYDPLVHIRARSGPWARCLCGVDWGFNHPTAIIPVLKDEQGALHVPAEWYERGKIESEVADAARTMRARFGVECFHVDPSAAALRETFIRAGLPVESANNDVSSGIMRVQTHMAIDGKGNTRLTIDPSCTNLLKEMTLYSWMEGGKDKPQKCSDDAQDSLRYGVMGITGGEGFGFKVIGDSEATERPHAMAARSQFSRDWTSIYTDPRGVW